MESIAVAPDTTLPQAQACQKEETGGLSCLVSSSLLEWQPDQDVVLEGALFHFPLLTQLRAASVNSWPVIGHQESRLDLRISWRKASACWRMWEEKALPCLIRKVKTSLRGLASDDSVNGYLCLFYYKIKLLYQFSAFGLLELILCIPFSWFYKMKVWQLISSHSHKPTGIFLQRTVLLYEVWNRVCALSKQ